MSSARPAGLSAVPRPLLEHLLRAIERGRVSAPLTEIDLLDEGLGAFVRPLLNVLSPLETQAILAVLTVTIAEREHRPPPHIDLVWSGPEVRASTSRDTSRVVQQLFESAEREVFVCGYTFDRKSILEPLHAVMKARPVRVTLLMDIADTAKTLAQSEAHARSKIADFLRTCWPAEPPFPAVYYDPRTARPGPPWCTLHAKCIVVDTARTLITSANFTDRGQTRNIEVGVLLDDPGFAADLQTQLQLLISSEQVLRYNPP
ncbi:MAG: DISARM system phospholipase D-like protein DrmC [Deltaproteobacteria bacterium]|nr:DISARM system phospholipase D-like protein DrmC [Deltaproteobacteria bacterium]